MSVSVHYPDDWIGIPDFGAGEVFETPGHGRRRSPTSSSPARPA